MDYRDDKEMDFIGRIVVFIGGIFILYFVVVISYGYYFSCTSEKSKYTVEIELLSGSKKAIVFTDYTNAHLQINCHSHKGKFRGCNLYVYEIYNKFLLPGSHSVRDGVIDFRILKKEKI